jgi:hypothetical protein
MKCGAALRGEGEYSIEHQHVKVHIEIEATAKSLNERDSAAFSATAGPSFLGANDHVDEAPPERRQRGGIEGREPP